jgi:imidazolonepropionase-like amidohydrolase
MMALGGASSCRFTVGYGSFPDKPSVSDGEEAAINPDQSSEAPATVRQHRWAVRAAGLFDGREWHPGRSLVVIDGDTITDVDTSGAEPPSDLDVTDLGRATLLPGLIDAHVHLAFKPQDRTQEGLADRDAGQIADHVRQSARAHLRAGVTTVRDLGDRDYAAVRLRDQPADPADPLPQVLASGPPITRTQGHCWYLGGEADDQAAVADIIARHVEHGVDLIKVMATGGVTTPGWGPHQSQYTRADLTAADAVAAGANAGPRLGTRYGPIPARDRSVTRPKTRSLPSGTPSTRATTTSPPQRRPGCWCRHLGESDGPRL